MAVYCINPNCQNRRNPDHVEICKFCGTPLLIKNRYRLLSPFRDLNHLGHSEIFEVDDLGVAAVQGERIKALKVLKTRNKTLVHLFRREAESLRELNHPGIPQIAPGDGYFTVFLSYKIKLLPYSFTKTLHCLVMEKVKGINLQKWVKENKIVSEEKVLDWLIQLLKIIDYLHHNNYIHRDIKPSNIILQPCGQLKLIDFGTVRKMTPDFFCDIGFDKEGTRIWSPGYTPDEVIQGKPLPQSDFYSLGRTLVHLVTGEFPIDLPIESGQLNWRERAPQISQKLASWIDYMMAEHALERPLNTSFILECLEGKTIEALPYAPVEIVQLPPLTIPQTITYPWLIRFNFALFCILLVTSSFWWHRQQDNQWQKFQQENALTQSRN
ncbi:MAG TPA: hypothetical protein DDZ80_23405 [Cyanobacteria bacterium UBA8803]|nr:hypothetical protein [Cyanobacteria bacterium UBA9273]HBL61270.1 hypothetical protein [Cyanobacteria bacterium UBA8803]